jgi:hypothetical protein
MSLRVSVESTIWTSDILIDGAVKLPVRETATELARCATGESVRRVRDIVQRGYDSSNLQPIYLHNDYLVGEVNLGSECSSRPVHRSTPPCAFVATS